MLELVEIRSLYSFLSRPQWSCMRNQHLHSEDGIFQGPVSCGCEMALSAPAFKTDPEGFLAMSQSGEVSQRRDVASH